MSNNKNSILIVDDESVNIVALTSILSSEYTVYAAKSGSKAIKLANDKKPDVILLDILMPEMNGFEVISEIRKGGETRRIPVIFVTGLEAGEYEEKGVELGAADFISKPFSSVIVKLRVYNQVQIVNLKNALNRISTTNQLTGY